jgi:hypothetical protein
VAPPTAPTPTSVAATGDGTVISLRSEPDPGDGGVSVPQDVGPELEAEVLAAAAMFDGLPEDWKHYLDHEACHGRDAYIRT